MVSSSADSIRHALWPATLRERRPLGDCFEEGLSVDIAIIGGGFAGCSAALAAAERGASVALFEARTLGWGASGRNGGQVIPGLKLDPSEMEAKYGKDAGYRLSEAVGAAADVVFSLIDKHGIDCAPRRGGWIQAAHAQTALARVHQRCDEWAARGAPVEKLDAAAVSRLLGTNAYVGGWIDRRAGTVHPLSYVFGLARAAQAAGAKLYEDTPATSLVRDDDGWLILTARGPLSARTVIVATDAYSGSLVPHLAQSMLLVQSAQVVTDPLPASLRERLVPNGICASETRRLAFYFRQSPDGRMMFGGRGAVGDNEQPAFTNALVAAMHRMFPDTRSLAIAYRWSGQVGLTLDGIPHIHEAEPNLLIGLGYNGRGVAMASLMGRWLVGKALDAVEPPLPKTALEPIAWHRLRGPAIALGVSWAWLRDRAGFAA
jgi:glycine/D-amino acid oxidase-like deaminating enzyme